MAEFQLGQVQEALDKEPSNAELQKLAGDLQELVALYTELVEAEEAAAVTQKKRPAPSVAQTPSDSADLSAPRKKWGEKEGHLHEVVVGEESVQKGGKLPANTQASGTLTNGTLGAPPPAKKKKVNKREVEQKSKQAAWLNFAAKPSTRKAVTGGGLKTKSMFATADEPNSVVGVIGSGKGMTAYQSRGKHRFDDDALDAKK